MSGRSGAVSGGIGPTSVTLLPPAVPPPFGPSVNSQTLPATSAASDVGPEAAFAAASVPKFSMRQYSGPDGNCLSFTSVTGSTTSLLCAAAVEGADAIAKSDNASAKAVPAFRVIDCTI